MEKSRLTAAEVKAPATEIYAIDNVHTNAAFTVRHLLISKVRGKFNDFTGTITLNNEDVTKSSIHGTIRTESIDTGDQARDAHLKSADFFGAEAHPEIVFKSTNIDRDRDQYLVHGDLTIRGITRPVSLKAELSGPIVDPWGNKKIGI